MKGIFILLLVFLNLAVACRQEVEDNQDFAGDFDEPFRPQFHFSPPANWMNDPNGMVYWRGEYHLFYQYFPEASVWGPMHWGHAISKDLVHWQHMPVAIEPDGLGWIFSGSAVADIHNTSGLGTKENPPLVALFTYHDPIGEKAQTLDFQTQGLAYSTDNGRTWIKYAGNPVLGNPGIRDFRDPKVIWIKHDSGNGKWWMSLAVEDKISFYSSPNLLEWSFESDFNPSWAAYGGVWECPDLFPLTAEGGTTKWVLLVSINPGGPQGGSATQYFIGDFDGKTFKADGSDVKWLDQGADNYAGVTWANVPEEDGRTLFIGWMSNWLYGQEVPTEGWRSAKTIPRALELINSSEGYLIASRPVAELKKLRKDSQEISGKVIRLEEELLEIILQPEEGDFKIELSNASGDKLVFEKSADVFYFDRGRSGLVDFNPEFTRQQQFENTLGRVNTISIFLDRSSIEIFINDGELVSSNVIFPSSSYDSMKLEGIQEHVQIYALKGIW